MAARNFPTFATDPTDSGAGTLDAKEYAALVADNGNFALENAAVTVAHTGGGSANAIATTTTPAITAYAADQTFWLVPTADNTGAVTIVRDGLATRAVVDKAGDALTGGELVTGNAYLMWDNGTHIRIMTPDASAGGGGSTGLTRILNAVDFTGASYEWTDMGDYQRAYGLIRGAVSPSENCELRMQCSDDNGTSYETSGYEDFAGSTGEAYAPLYTGNAWDAAASLDFNFFIERRGDQLYIEGGNNFATNNIRIFDNGNTVDALKFYADGGSISGTATLTVWAE